MIERSASGVAVLCCDVCRQHRSIPRRDIEELLTFAIGAGWTLVNGKGEPQITCPYCRGIHGAKRTP